MARTPVFDVVLESLDGGWEQAPASGHDDDPGRGSGWRSLAALAVGAVAMVGALVALGSGQVTPSEDPSTEGTALVADPTPSTTVDDGDDASAPAPRPERRGRDRRTVIVPDVGGAGVVMLFGNEAFTLDLDDTRGAVTSLTTDDDGVVLVQGSGVASRFSRDSAGTLELGPASVVYPANVGVWLISPGLVGQVVRHLVGPDELPSVVLPADLSVAGSVGNSLLGMDGGGQWWTWNPVTGERTFAWVDGRVLTTAHDMLATDYLGDVLLGRPSTSARWRLPLYDVDVGPARFSDNALWIAVVTTPTDPAEAAGGTKVEVWKWSNGDRLTIEVDSVADLAVTDNGEVTVLTGTGELHVYSDEGRLIRQFIRPPRD